MKENRACRWLIYLAGLLVLALGITLNTKVNLGVSPIISVSYCISRMSGLNFADVTLVQYSVFVLAELGLHLWTGRRDGLSAQGLRVQLFKDALQFPLSLVFTRFLALFSLLIPEQNGSMVPRLLILALGIACTGAGAAASLDVRLVPNPGDGIVQTLADVTGQRVGLVKNCFDGFSIAVTAVLSLIFTGRVIGIGVGTLLAVLGVGRVMAWFNRRMQEKIERASGLRTHV